MRVPREVWWIVGLSALMVLIAYLLGVGPQETEDEGFFNRTTYSSRPYGLRALYLTLQKLGYSPRRLRHPLRRAALPKEGTLVIVDPMPVTGAEWEDVCDWVSNGNALVLAGRDVLPAVEETPAEVDLFTPGPPTTARPTQPTYLAHGVEGLAVRSSYRIQFPSEMEDMEAELEEALGGESEEVGEEPEECPWGVCTLGSRVVDDALVNAAPVFADEHGVVVACAGIGRGRAVLLASPWSLSNEGIAEEDNLIFALNALGAQGDSPIYFDEYHHGYSENALLQAMPLPVRLGLVQVALGLVLIALARSPRLGPVVPLVRGGRQRSEFLGTMTAVLQRGRATHLALRTAHDTIIGELKAQLGIPADADANTVVRAVNRVDPTAGEELAAVLTDVHDALAGSFDLSEGLAAELVRRLEAAAAAARRI